MNKLKSHINRATDPSNKELLSAGININIPPKTWLYLGCAIGVPAVLIILLIIVKDIIIKK